VRRPKPSSGLTPQPKASKGRLDAGYYDGGGLERDGGLVHVKIIRSLRAVGVKRTPRLSGGARSQNWVSATLLLG